MQAGQRALIAAAEATLHCVASVEIEGNVKGKPSQVVEQGKDQKYL